MPGRWCQSNCWHFWLTLPCPHATHVSGTSPSWQTCHRMPISHQSRFLNIHHPPTHPSTTTHYQEKQICFIPGMSSCGWFFLDTKPVVKLLLRLTGFRTLSRTAGALASPDLLPQIVPRRSCKLSKLSNGRLFSYYQWWRNWLWVGQRFFCQSACHCNQQCHPWPDWP